jgi:hypothetical protein
MSKSSNASRHEPPSGGIFGNPFFWVVIIVAAVGAAIWLALPNGSSSRPTTPTPVKADSAAGASPVEKLKGRWLRPDGGYVLEIKAGTDDGKLAAGYFNPNPINVSRAEWSRVEGKVRVFVELRDVNYNGATYTLDYDTAQDKMTGVYFQPALGQSFPVEFVRE